jgi:hypothetical protein
MAGLGRRGREHNPWRTFCRLNPAERRAIDSGKTLGTDLLARLAREHGHRPVELCG